MGDEGTIELCSRREDFTGAAAPQGDRADSDCRLARSSPLYQAESLMSSAVPSSSLHRTLRVLFALNGAAMQLPSLALLSIVNDRASIPPIYLPAYGAVSFLPWSLKPIYAFLTIAIVGGDRSKHRWFLLAVLLVLSGLSYAGTAFIPADGVIECFVWGFLRGLALSWAEFLLDLELIESARNRSSPIQGGSPPLQLPSTAPSLDNEFDSHGTAVSSSRASQLPKLSYEELSSIFQSQAATWRNFGSLVASVVLFCLFTWRHYRLQNTKLGDAVVMALLFLTASLNWIGSLIVTWHNIRRTTILQDEADDRVFLNEWNHSANGETLPGVARQTRPWSLSEHYDAVATEENCSSPDTCDRLALSTEAGFEATIPPEEKETNPMETSCEKGNSWKRQERFDVALLALLQVVLILTALKGPIVSTTSNICWIVLISLIGFCFVATLVIASCSAKRNEGGDESIDINVSNAIPPRRLGLYLILRHSVPIAGYLMYSFIYTVFAADPLFLQILSIVESATSTAATWFYGRFLAKTYSSGWNLIGLIAVLSVVASLVSLLDVLVVRAGSASLDGDDSGSENNPARKNMVDGHLRLLVFFVRIFTYFLGELSFMPSVVLATANVVSRVGPSQERPSGSDRCDQLDGGNTGTQFCDSTGPPSPSHQGTARDRPALDEGMQYASFVSCIDFGAQVGDWISVPIVSSLGIKRETAWSNLDHFIVVCTLARIASVSFLWIIRPRKVAVAST